MTDRPVILDRHRGMAAQKATEIRRLLGEVAANEKALRQRQEELEAQLIAAPATTWLEVRRRPVICSAFLRRHPSRRTRADNS
jgi:alpha-D-ribose 1-methylphosphonate 5-triphosphate synthase subunit PhnL